MKDNPWKTNAIGKKFIASYSGGKDSTLALYHAMQAGKAKGLIIMLEEQGQRSRSHGMTLDIIQAQANALGLPFYYAASDWNNYETKFIELLTKSRNDGVDVLVTGDIDMPEHGCWHDKVTQSVGLNLAMPLWQRPHRHVVEEFIELGFEAIVVTVNLTMGMMIEDLGKTLTLDFIQELENRRIDPCGESGEFHTTVFNGPIFKTAIPIQKLDIQRHGDYAFLPLDLTPHIT